MKSFLLGLNWKNPVTVGVILAILFLLYQMVGGFIWFVIQTAIYGGILMAVLFILKKKGFFKS